MSRRDARKALMVPLPRDLRRALRARAAPGQSLAGVVCALLRRTDLSCIAARPIGPCSGRALLVQVPPETRARVAALARRLDLSEAGAVRVVLAQVLDIPEEDGP